MNRAFGVIAFGFLAAIFTTGHAATITVNSATDVVDDSDGRCSFREALVAANTNLVSGNIAGECTDGRAPPEVDEIVFAIAGTALIKPSPALPLIIEPLEIDGTSQSGFVINSAALNQVPDLVTSVSISGEMVFGNFDSGLEFSPASTGSSVRGVHIHSFPYAQINIAGAANVAIQGNRIGRLPSSALQSIGVLVEANNVNLGGSLVSQRNVIQATNTGVLVADSVSNLNLEGNVIGFDSDGLGAVGNSFAGVAVFGSTGNASNLVKGNVIASPNRAILVGGGTGLGIDGNFLNTKLHGLAPLFANPTTNFTSAIEIDDYNSWLDQFQNNKNVLVENNVMAAQTAAAQVYRYQIGDEVTNHQFLNNKVIRPIDAFFNAGGYSRYVDLGPFLSLSEGTPNGLNANDSSDLDEGPNTGLNRPILSAATIANGVLTVTGTVDSAPNMEFRLEVFNVMDQQQACGPASPAASALPRNLLKTVSGLTTDAQGHFDVSLNFSVANFDSNFTGKIGAALRTVDGSSEMGDCVDVTVVPGSAATGLLVLGDSQFDFPRTRVGTNSGALGLQGYRVLTPTNKGNAPLTITSTVTAGDFQIGGCGGASGITIAANNNCYMEIRFTPTGNGFRFGTLTFNHNGSGGSRVIDLVGYGDSAYFFNDFE